MDNDQQRKDLLESLQCDLQMRDTNENGDYPTGLGGIVFSSISVNTTFYLDDFNYLDPIIVGTEADLNSGYIKQKIIITED